MTKRRGRNGIIPRTAEERIRARLQTDPSTGCHVYTGALDRKGYARVAKGMGAHRNVLAHRVIYEAERGQIPDGLTLDHLCRNHACCNPDHLEPVTAGENSRRGWTARLPATHCQRGHEFTAANTLGHRDGRRRCRACRDERERHRYSGACPSDSAGQQIQHFDGGRD